MKEQDVSWSKKLGRIKKVIKFEKVSGKEDILTIEEIQVDPIVNKTKRNLAMTPRQIELEKRRLKATKIWIKKKSEKEKEFCQILIEKYVEGSYK